MKMLRAVLYGLDKMNLFLEMANPVGAKAGKLLQATRVASAVRLATSPRRMIRRAALSGMLGLANWALRKSSGRAR